MHARSGVEWRRSGCKEAGRATFVSYIPPLSPSVPSVAAVRHAATSRHARASNPTVARQTVNPPVVRQKSISVLNTGCGASAPTLMASFLTASSSESIRDCCCSSNASFSSTQDRPLLAFNSVDSLLSRRLLHLRYTSIHRAPHTRGFFFYGQTHFYFNGGAVVMRNH